MRNAIKTSLLAAAGTLLLTPNFALAQSPSDFTEHLRPRVWVGENETRYTLEERMAHFNVPGVAVAVIEDGEVIYAAGFGVQQLGGDMPVDGDTLFSAGSVSKVATAALIMRLDDQGVIDIDAPVSDYLSSWQMPDQAEYDENDVTLRAILAHTAGFNIHGFGDFQPGADLPTVYYTLNGAAPADHAALELTFAPGTGYRYSGGGYTLAQLVVADATGQTFQAASNAALFDPLGLERSTFANPLPEDVGNIARAHDRSGEPAALPRGYEAMPEMAASGLWTSASELGGIVSALIASYREEGGYLRQSTAEDMMTRVAPSQHGVGPRLDGRGNGYFFHHAGANNSYHTWIEGHLVTGDGLVVLTNGSNGNGLHMEIRNAVADAMDWQINPVVRAPELELSEAHLQSLTGVYSPSDTFPVELRQQMQRWIYGADLEIALGAEGLGLGRAGGDSRLALIPVTPSRFIIDGFSMREGVAEVEFHRNASGQTHAMTFYLANAASHYHRLDQE